MKPENLQAIYETEEDRQLARILSILIWASWGTYLFVILTGLYFSDWKVIAVTLACSALLIVPFVLLRRRHLRASSLIVVLSALVTVTIIATVGQGIRDLAIVAFPIVFVFAGLTLNRALFRLCVGLSLLGACWLVVGEVYGWFTTKPFDQVGSNWFYLIGVIILLLVAALAVDLLATNMRKNLELARQEIAERKRTEESLALTQFCVDQAFVGIMRTDTQAKITSANDQMCQMLGYTADELVNLHIYDIDPNFPLERWQAHRQQLRSKRSDRHETIHRRKDGTTFPVEISNSYVELKGASFSFSFVQDITERKRAEEALHASQQLLQKTIASFRGAILIVDAQTDRIRDCNPSATRVFGYAQDEMIGQTTHFLHVDAKSSDEFREHLDSALASSGFQSDFGFRMKRKNGTIFPSEHSVTMLKDEQGNLIGFVHVVRDITERRRAEEQLLYLGTHDALTDIYNRSFFEAELVRFESSREFPVSVIVADVDKLKMANDTQGHAAGDELLRHAANVLRLVFRKGDVLARTGGDEFAVLLPATDSATVEQMVSRIRERLTEHHTQYPDLSLGLSLGAATAEKGNLTGTLAVADQRMYVDKSAHQLSENDSPSI